MDFEEEYFLSYNLQFFAKEGEGGEKTEEPTSKKLEDARKKGQVAKSVDVTTAFSLLVFFYGLQIFLDFVGEQFDSGFKYFLGKIDEVATRDFSLQYACSIVGDVLYDVVITVGPFFILALAVAFITNVAQVKWQVTFEPMKPSLNKINPISGFKKLFSKDKLFDLLKSLVKLGVLAFVVYSFLKDKWSLVLNMYSYSLSQAISIIGDIIINIGIRISAFFIVIAAADFGYQKWKFHEDMKMSKQEVKDEYKQQEGDPKVKSQQKSRMQQASRRRMMQDLPNADVVITNPTHLSVAIQYDKENYEAPIVLAKGADHLAMKIREIASEHHIEIVENKPLARMLYHNVDLGAEIPPELYQSVAEILAYVYSLKTNQ